MKVFKVKANGVTREVEAKTEGETAYGLYCRLPFELSLREDLEIDGEKFGIARLKEEKEKETIVIDKVVIKEKYYGRIKSETQYKVLGKTYYAGITDVRSIKKMLKEKGFSNILINDRGVSKMNY